VTIAARRQKGAEVLRLFRQQRVQGAAGILADLFGIVGFFLATPKLFVLTLALLGVAIGVLRIYKNWAKPLRGPGLLGISVLSGGLIIGAISATALFPDVIRMTASEDSRTTTFWGGKSVDLDGKEQSPPDVAVEQNSDTISLSPGNPDSNIATAMEKGMSGCGDVRWTRDDQLAKTGANICIKTDLGEVFSFTVSSTGVQSYEGTFEPFIVGEIIAG
jgi:hypothetical protein